MVAQLGVCGRCGLGPVPGRYPVDVAGHREVQVGDAVPGVVRGDREPDALPPDVHVGVMPYLAGLGRHVHRQVHALVVGVPERLADLVTLAGPPVQLAQALLDLLVSQRLSECHRAYLRRAGCQAMLAMISPSSRPAAVCAQPLAWSRTATSSRRSRAEPVSCTRPAAPAAMLVTRSGSGSTA